MNNNGNGWRLEVGYQGKRFWVYDDNWEVCIYEDLSARRARFCVLEMSELQSRHEELTGPAGAKAAVLKRLIELAKQGTVQPAGLVEVHAGLARKGLRPGADGGRERASAPAGLDD